MADILTEANNWLSSGNNIIYLMLLGAVIVIVFLVASKKSKQKEYKAIDLRKQIKLELTQLYNTFGEPVNKSLFKNGVEIGKVLGFMPLIWNEEISIKDNIQMNSKSEVKDVVMQVKGYDNKDEEKIKIAVTMKCCKVSSRNKLKKALGLGTRFHIIKDKLLTYDGVGWIISASSQPAIFYDIIFYNVPARVFVEDVGFRINRENELNEIANSVPRVVFWDNEFAKRAMAMREDAEIQKARFKGQKEAAED